MQPYTYLIRCIPTNQAYYGVRYSKTCKPSDLWKSYFTSSKRVKALLKEFGKDSFEFEVRKVFSTKQAALQWEQKVLRRMKVRENPTLWLNRHIWGQNFYNDGGYYKFSQYRIDRIKEANTGKTRSDDTKQKISAGHKGKITSESTKSKLRQNKQQTYIVTLPCGKDVSITNLKLFCVEHNLDMSSMWGTIPRDGKPYGKTNHHKGYKVRRPDQDKHQSRPKYKHSDEIKRQLSILRQARIMPL